MKVIKREFEMKVIKERHMRKWGYVIKSVEHDNAEYGGEGVTVLKQAYTPDGHYIGSSKTAARLCKRMGIKPELKRDDCNVCSIGFCESDGKWYGWSHRAIYGFKVGSTCKQGDCHYKPFDKDDFALECKNFWSDEDHKDVKVREHRDPELGLGIQTDWTYANTIKNESLRGTIYGLFTPYPDEFGLGEWEAKTMKDAKQMAIDFADGVN